VRVRREAEAVVQTVANGNNDEDAAVKRAHGRKETKTVNA